MVSTKRRLKKTKHTVKQTKKTTTRKSPKRGVRGAKVTKTRTKKVLAKRKVKRSQTRTVATVSEKQLPAVWTMNLPKGLECLGLHVDEDMCWVGDDNGDVFGVDHQGIVHAAYHFPAGVFCVLSDGNWKYVGGNNGKVYDITSATPRVIASIGAGHKITWMSMLRGRLVVADSAGVVMVIDHDGETLWRKNTDGGEGWTARCDPTGVYYGNNRAVVKYSWTGEELWSVPTPGEVQLGWIEDQRLFVPMNNGKVWVLNADSGEKLFEMAGDQSYLPTCTAEPEHEGGRIFVTDDVGCIYGFNSKGTRQWKLRTPYGGVASSQYFQGNLYIVTWSGQFACIDVTDEAIHAALEGKIVTPTVIDLTSTATTDVDTIVGKLSSTQSVGDGIELVCVKDHGKLRVRVLSKGYHQEWNCQFPMDLRKEGEHYVVEAVHEVKERKFYRVTGEIKRLDRPNR